MISQSFSFHCLSICCVETLRIRRLLLMLFVDFSSRSMPCTIWKNEKCFPVKGFLLSLAESSGFFRSSPRRVITLISQHPLRTHRFINHYLRCSVSFTEYTRNSALCLYLHCFLKVKSNQQGILSIFLCHLERIPILIYQESKCV